MGIMALLKTGLNWISSPKNRWVIFILIGFIAGFWLSWKIKKCNCPELVRTVTVTVRDTIKPKDTITAQFTASNATTSTRPIPIFKKTVTPDPRIVRDTVKDSVPYTVHDTVIKTYENQNCYSFKVWFNEKAKVAVISNTKPDSLYCAFAEFRICSIIFPKEPPADIFAEMNYLPGAYVRETTTTTNNLVIKLPFYKNKWFYGTIVLGGVTGYLVYDKLKKRG